MKRCFPSPSAWRPGEQRRCQQCLPHGVHKQRSLTTAEPADSGGCRGGTFPGNSASLSLSRGETSCEVRAPAAGQGPLRPARPKCFWLCGSFCKLIFRKELLGGPEVGVGLAEWWFSKCPPARSGVKAEKYMGGTFGWVRAWGAQWGLLWDRQVLESRSRFHEPCSRWAKRSGNHIGTSLWGETFPQISSSEASFGNTGCGQGYSYPGKPGYKRSFSRLDDAHIS